MKSLIAELDMNYALDIMKSQTLYGGECHEFDNKKLFHSCLPNAQIPLN